MAEITKNIYLFPFKKENFINAISDPRAHFAHFKYAIDFSLPEGTIILASKAGTVIDVKVDSKKGGNSPKYIKHMNYVTLKHSNEEYSQYGHLKYKSALVKLGEKVKIRQPIALSGNTGLQLDHTCILWLLNLIRQKLGGKRLK